jgi:streptogramin lyase
VVHIESLRFWLLAVVFLLTSGTSASAAPRAIPVPGLASPGEALVRAGDGAMWVAQPANPGVVARVSAGGVIGEYRGGVTPNFTVDAQPRGLALTPEGTIWFLMTGGFDELGRITTAGVVGRYTLADGHPTSLTGGSDGRLWMTLDGDPGDPDAIVALNPATGAIIPYTAGFDATTDPHAITAGPDGALWFVGSQGLGRITTEGELRWESVFPSALAAGPLGSLWYAAGSAVARLGAPPIATGAVPSALSAGPDGALWAAAAGGALRVEPGGAVTRVSTGDANGVGIAAGPDGYMWMTLDRAPYLVRVTVPPRIESLQAGTGTLEALVTPNGLDTDVSAEALSPDGTWRVLGSTHVPAGTAGVPVALALGGLTAGTTQVRLTAANEAGSVSTSSVAVTTPGPAPVSTPQPVEGKTVVVTVLSGTVALKVPGQRAYAKLSGTATVPMKTLVDTTSGRVKLAAMADGKPQVGRFDSGKFRVTQHANGITQLALAGPLSCGKRARVAAKPKPKKRRLWGSDSGGKYRTHGQNSVATVRGTRWLTEDTCAGTRVHVSVGSVRVWDTKGGRSVILRAGQERFTPR